MTTKLGPSGFCHAAFQPVYEAFDTHLKSCGQSGAALAIAHDGWLVVDLWGGVAASGVPWDRETAAVVMSTTKALTYTCMLSAASHGVLDLDAPVSEWWPEFGRHGKSTVTIRQTMAHQAGVPGVDPQLGIPEIIAWEPVMDALAKQQPMWEPGTAHGYHPMTSGWILSEVLRRASGLRAAEYFEAFVATPYGLNVSIGNRDAHRSIAPLIPPGPPTPGSAFDDLYAAFGDPQSITSRSFRSPTTLPFDFNSPEVLGAEIPSGNGVADARSLALLYASLIGDVEGRPQLVPDALLRQAVEPCNSGHDQVVLVRTDFASGFMRPGGPMFPIQSRTAFGHAGAGGSLAFADPGSGLAFGYVMNQMSPGLAAADKTRELVAAAYECMVDDGLRG